MRSKENGQHSPPSNSRIRNSPSSTPPPYSARPIVPILKRTRSRRDMPTCICTVRSNGSGCVDQTCSVAPSLRHRRRCVLRLCPTQVIQGGIGNCCVCSGLASLAAGVPQLLHSAFGAEGHERNIVLDDYLFYKTANDCCSPSTHSSRQTDLWIRLLEMPCARSKDRTLLRMVYTSMVRSSLYRHPGRALQLLTGAPVAFELRYGLPLVGSTSSFFGSVPY